MDVTTALEKCLRQAVTEEELVKDLVAACKMSGCTVEAIAAWTLAECSERLYLTADEATRLIENCRVATGVTVQEPVSVEVPQNDSKAIDLPASAAVGTVEVKPEQPVEPAAEEPAKTSNTSAEAAEETQDGKTETPASYSPPTDAVPELVRSASPKPMRPTSAPVTRKTITDMTKSIPSYLRPTTAHTLRTSKQLDPATLPKEKTPGSPADKPGLLSRLLAPTAAFLSRMTHTKAETKAVREAVQASQALRKSQVLSAVLSHAPGQRVTKPQPFRMATDTRPKSSTTLTTDEAAMMEAQKHAFKRHEVPADLRESKNLEGFARTHTTPKEPTAVFKPFQLSSAEKHAKYQEMQSARLAAEKQQAEEARVFKAMELKTDIFKTPDAGLRKSMSTTVPIAIHFRSAERAEHHARVIEPARRARMSSTEREALEERERRAAAEEEEAAARAKKAEEEAAHEAALLAMDITSYRKSLAFKARDLPDFSSPFKPDHAKAAPVTRASAFNLQTTQRLGDFVPVREREDAAAPSLSASVCLAGTLGGAYGSTLRSYAGPARGAASVRASVNTLHPRAGRPTSAMAAMRASTSQLPSGSTRPATGRVGRVRPQVVPELKEALEVALEAATSPRVTTRRNTEECPGLRASNPQVLVS